MDTWWWVLTISGGVIVLTGVSTAAGHSITKTVTLGKWGSLPITQDVTSHTPGSPGAGCVMFLFGGLLLGLSYLTRSCAATTPRAAEGSGNTTQEAANPGEVRPPTQAQAPSEPSESAWAEWGRTAAEHRGAVGQRFPYHCSPGGTPGTVYGTDVYTDDSSVCTAAVHAGRIQLNQGGTVTIEVRPGQRRYSGSSRHGVHTDDYQSWDGSFRFTN
jgi:hypothetical protein